MFAIADAQHAQLALIIIHVSLHMAGAGLSIVLFLLAVSRRDKMRHQA